MVATQVTPKTSRNIIAKGPNQKDLQTILETGNYEDPKLLKFLILVDEESVGIEEIPCKPLIMAKTPEGWAIIAKFMHDSNQGLWLDIRYNPNPQGEKAGTLCFFS